MRRLLLPVSLLFCAVSASAGLIPPGRQVEPSTASEAPDTEALMAANISELPVRPSDSLQQISLSESASLLDQTTANQPDPNRDRFFVLIGDGSATTVRTLAARFRTRGEVLEPVSTLDSAFSRVGPMPDLAPLTDEDGRALDPALLLKVAAAARSIAGGKQFEVPVMTMDDAPFILGGGAAGLWGLLAIMKTIRNRRRGPVKRVKVRAYNR